MGRRQAGAGGPDGGELVDDEPTPKTPAPEPEPEREPEREPVAVPRAVDHGAGVILAVLLWSWLVMPFIQGTDPNGSWDLGKGLTQVRNVLRAKFVNKAPDGSWLP